MENRNTEIEHSKLDMASYGFAKFLSEFLEMAFTSWSFYFYERVIGLNVLWVGLGYILFALWNAFNDPAMGFLTNRPFKFTKKWGRRFPWIMIGGSLYVISFVFIFLPPSVDPNSGAFILFLWLLITTCVFDLFNSIFFINFVSLFPDKFRSVKERRKATSIQTPIGILGIAFGALIPAVIVDETVPFTFVINALVMSIVGLIVLVLAIPGSKEDQVTIDMYLDKHQDKSTKTPFFESMRKALAQKSFVVFIMSYTLYRCLVISMQASIPYVVDIVLNVDTIFVTILSAGFLIGALVSSPLWARYAQKANNNKKALLYSSLLLVIFTIPLTFMNMWEILFIGILLWGFGLGGYWTMISPVLADVLDEAVITHKKREEGVYNGFLQFFGRLGILFQAILFVIVHVLTGFVEGSSTQTALATIGIQLHFALIPAIVMLIGTLLFWKYYKLTPDKVAQHQAEVKKLKL